MSLRPPRSLTPVPADDALNPLRHEIAQEQAASLRLSGKRLEDALAALAAWEGDAQGKDALIQKAAEQAWIFMMQREFLGLRDWNEVAALYRVPAAVLVRMGASPKKENA